MYSEKEILEFTSTLDGFKCAAKIASLFQGELATMNSQLLVQCTFNKQQDATGKFPELSDALHFFETAFDHEKAKEVGRITPSKGIDPEYDSVLEGLQNLQQELDAVPFLI
jgi:DNA mismatch repair protein MSH6